MLVDSRAARADRADRVRQPVACPSRTSRVTPWPTRGERSSARRRAPSPAWPDHRARTDLACPASPASSTPAAAPSVTSCDPLAAPRPPRVGGCVGRAASPTRCFPPNRRATPPAQRPRRRPRRSASAPRDARRARRLLRAVLARARYDRGFPAPTRPSATRTRPAEVRSNARLGGVAAPTRAPCGHGVADGSARSRSHDAPRGGGNSTSTPGAGRATSRPGPARQGARDIRHR